MSSVAEVTAAPTRAPLDLVEALARTPRFGGEARGFDADERYWYFAYSTAEMILLVSVGLVALYQLWAFARKCCWACQRERFGDRRSCGGPRAASRAQRALLIAWVAAAVVGFAALTVAAQTKLADATGTVEDALDALAAKYDALDAASDGLAAISADLAARAAAVRDCVGAADAAADAAAYGAAAARAVALTDGVARELARAERVVGDRARPASASRGREKKTSRDAQARPGSTARSSGPSASSASSSRPSPTAPSTRAPRRSTRSPRATASSSSRRSRSSSPASTASW